MKVSFGSPITRYVALSIAGCLATVLVLVFIVYSRTSESFEQANIALLRQNVITVDSSLRAFMEGDPRNSVGFPKYMEKLRGTREVVEAESNAAMARFSKFQEEAKKSNSDLGGMARHFKAPVSADQKLEYQLRIIPADVTRLSTLKNAMARIKSELQETPEWKDKTGPELDAATQAEYDRLYPAADNIEALVLENALAYEQWDNEASVFRMTVPVAAEKSCIDCHNVAREGQPLGAITVIHSLDRAQEMKAALTREIGVIAGISVFALLLMGVWNARSLQRVLLQVSSSIVGVSGRLRTHVKALHGANEAVAGGVTRQREAMQKTHEAVDAMTAISQQAAGNARNSTTLIGNVDSALADGAAIVKRMNESMADIRKASDEVSGITRVINEIAFKTNLLAINAAIEAARAGDAGRGFAVVADEVRTLARRSAEAASEVDAKIAAAIEKSSTGTRISSELLVTFEKARQSVGESRALIARIVEETQRQSASAGEHQAAVGGVEQILDATVADARSAEDAARKLEIESETLEGSLDSLRKLMSVNVPQFKPELRPVRSVSTIMPARA